jgi:uncharacterized protein DUF4845
MIMRKYQTGMGALGWLIVLAIASFCLTCFFKMGPLYLEYWQTKGALDSALSNSTVATMDKDALLNSIEKSLDVSRIESITKKDIRVTDKNGVREIDASYEKRTPLIANIDVVLKFDKLKYKLSAAQ